MVDTRVFRLLGLSHGAKLCRSCTTENIELYEWHVIVVFRD